MISSVLIGIVFWRRIVGWARLGAGRGGSQVSISRIAGNICRLGLSRLFLCSLVWRLLAGTAYNKQKRSNQ